MERRYLVVPGMRSSRVYIVDTKPDARAPRIVKVIDAAEMRNAGDAELLGPCVRQLRVRDAGVGLAVLLADPSLGLHPIEQPGDAGGRQHDGVGQVPECLR